MPRSPQWFHQLANALAQLQTFPAPVVDRASLEKLLQISRRSAIRLLHEFGGYQAGRTFLIRREDLIAALERVQSGETFSYEVRRRVRLAEDLERDAPGLANPASQAAGRGRTTTGRFPARRHADRSGWSVGGPVC